MHISHRQEAFSMAYLRAVAAAAGYRVQEGPLPDDDSVDLTLSARGPGGTVRSPSLDVQVKCQLGPPDGGEEWAYDLKAKNYEDLRHEDFMVPRVLVVVVVPNELSEWLLQDEAQLRMQHCGWWVSLRGFPRSDNESTVRVKIPRSQRFDVAGLTGLMHRIGDGGPP